MADRKALLFVVVLVIVNAFSLWVIFSNSIALTRAPVQEVVVPPAERQVPAGDVVLSKSSGKNNDQQEFQYLVLNGVQVEQITPASDEKSGLVRTDLRISFQYQGKRATLSIPITGSIGHYAGGGESEIEYQGVKSVDEISLSAGDRLNLMLKFRSTLVETDQYFDRLFGASNTAVLDPKLATPHAITTF